MMNSRLLVRLLAILIACITVGILAEVYLRIKVPQLHEKFVRFESISNFKHFAYDPNMGWKGRPHFEGKVARTDFYHDFRHNSLGFRDEEFGPKQAEKIRLMAVGDSFVWGWGAEEKNTFASIIEQDQPNVEVMNLGISGYGTDQEYLLIKETVDQFQPDVVLLFYYINDTLSNIQETYEDDKWPKPYFIYDESEKLQPQNLPIPNIEEKIAQFDNGINDKRVTGVEAHNRFVKIALEKSHLVTFIVDKLQIFPTFQSWLEGQGVILPHQASDIGSLLHNFDEREGQPWKITADLMKMTSEVLAEKNIPFVVVYLPYKQQIYPEIIPASKRDEYDLDKPQRILSDLLKERNINFFDLTPAFKEAHQQDARELFFRTDDHFTVRGHQLTARIILEQLESILK